jgi:hypothetical protein
MLNGFLIPRKAKIQARAASGLGEPPVSSEQDKGHHNAMLMMRILGPIMSFVDRPWKVGATMIDPPSHR